MVVLSPMQLKYLYRDLANPALNLITSKQTNLMNVPGLIPTARKEFEFICVLFVVL